MNVKFRLDERGIWRMINGGLLLGIALLAGGDFWGIGALEPVHLAAGLAAVLLLMFFNYAPARGRILCLAGVLAGLACVGAVAGFQNCAAFFYSYFRWLTGNMPWREEWVTGYGVVQTLLLAFACYALEAAMEKEFRLRTAGVGLLLALLAYCLFTGRGISHLAVALLICYGAVFYAEWTQRRWKKEREGSIQAYMLRVMPFLGVYLLLMILMPAPKEPYGWQFVRAAYQHVRESFVELAQNMIRGRKEEYGMAFSGFSEEGELEGGFLEDDREMMRVRAENGLRTNIYLVGKVYDTFDGRQWKQLNEDTFQERLADTVETLYAAQRYDNHFFSDYLYPVNLTVSYRYFNTAFLFAPLKTWELKQGRGSLDFRQEGGSLLFEKKKGYGTEYQVNFYQMNGGQESFYRFLEAEQEEEEEMLEDLLKNLEMRTDVRITPEDIRRNREKIYEVYLDETALSGRTAEYLEKVTEDASTDVEKLRAIERELSSFAYTRQPGELPESVTNGGEFLDYFLLEGRQGYCNYFATAFVLLARSQGIPARFVQGFCVPALGREETVVYANMAHAWPEVYLEGIGWIPFEPTPGYGAMRYTPWNLKNKEGSLAAGSERPLEDREEASSLQGMEKMELSREIPDAEAEGRGEEIRRTLEMAGLVTVSVLGAALLVLLAGYWLGRYRYRKMPAEKKFKAEVAKNLRILAWLGVERTEEETLEEFGGRARELSGAEELFFVEAYEEFLYGGKTIDSDHVAAVRKEREGLLRILKEKRRWAYICYCIRNVF